MTDTKPANSTGAGNTSAPDRDDYHYTVAAIIGIFILIGIGAYYQIVILVVVCVGAVGGLAHEIVQSQGKYMLPSTDSTGNFCLGGLVGLVEGGIAGVLLIQGQQGNPVFSQSILISAFVAGLALKGVADSVNPPQSTPAGKASPSPESTPQATLTTRPAPANPAKDVPQLDPDFTVVTDNRTPFKIMPNDSTVSLKGQVGVNATAVLINWLDGSHDTCSLSPNASGFAFQSPSHTYNLPNSSFTIGTSKYAALDMFPEITVTSGNKGAITYNTREKGRCISITVQKIVD